MILNNRLFGVQLLQRVGHGHVLDAVVEDRMGHEDVRRGERGRSGWRSPGSIGREGRLMSPSPHSCV